MISAIAVPSFMASLPGAGRLIRLIRDRGSGIGERVKRERMRVAVGQLCSELPQPGWSAAQFGGRSTRIDRCRISLRSIRTTTAYLQLWQIISLRFNASSS
jgi:hypothetical protein